MPDTTNRALVLRNAVADAHERAKRAERTARIRPADLELSRRALAAWNRYFALVEQAREVGAW